MPSEKHLVIGLMSGTSVDAVDAALIETDGEDFIRPIAFVERHYTPAEHQLIRAAALAAMAMPRPAEHPLIADAERVLTLAHAEAIAALPGQETALLVGFHGQTVAHKPAEHWSWQIGDAGLLAQLTGRSVVHDFRSADVAAGGQGAPLAPGFHRALAAGLDRPMGVLNLGGIGNLTWFADDRWGAFDTGPGNSLIDDWMQENTDSRYDADGALAATGAIRDAVLTALCDLPWFDQPGPKSLDRADFSIAAARGLSAADGAATLTAFTAETIRLALVTLPVPLKRLLITGGGARNPTLMRMIEARTGVPTAAVETEGWHGDALEAQAFAWLAVRHIKGLPLSWPETTGVQAPMMGGRLAAP